MITGSVLKTGNLRENETKLSRRVSPVVCCIIISETYSEMAESSISVDQEQFSCSICLDLLKGPVTIPCGHSYCMSCITDYWDQNDQKRDYSCPQCRQTFTPRPVLGKNTMLAEVVEKLKNTKLQAHDQCYAEPGDVKCDVCTGKKHKAVKSCLVCLYSYCRSHLEQHENLFKVKRHKVTDATERLQQMICSQHDKLLEFYCCTDQCCICYLCMAGKHKNHITVSAEEERIEEQKQLKETQSKYRQMILKRQKELQELKKTVKTHERTAQAAVEDSERIFNELIRSIERSRSEMIKLIRDQEKTEVSQAEELLKRLEQEIDDLKRRDTELEQLSHTDDHIHFLQSFQSLSVPPGSFDSFCITLSSLLSFDDVKISKEKLECLCREKIKKIYDRGYCQVTLNPNTAQKFPHLSEQELNKKELTAEELTKQLDRLLQDKADNQTICNWIEGNLDEKQIRSHAFVRALMTSVCQSAITRILTYKVDMTQLSQRAGLLSKYLCDEEKELQALYALQALVVKMKNPSNLLRMFFDCLYDEDIIQDGVFFKWELSKDPAECLGKGAALKSVNAFFIWLREDDSEP
ncbi:Eukaryotic translation initiation factor 4 gamma 3 [Triplophysa tibetana]|uniref:Eukaryotic translation initiation factor 4 gamma 3 n=1 Tax=Triplophysa tibetana TaxID=1572043 RepID=A0A5A9PCF6_9TELE|nr:Eukaryotic translation initiation factor 4 gamma 3 [Triplophysa tibetana]